MNEVGCKCGLSNADPEAVREASGRPAVHCACAILPSLGDGFSISSIHFHVGTMGETSSELEASAVNDAVQLVFLAVGDDAFLCDTFDALA